MTINSQLSDVMFNMDLGTDYANGSIFCLTDILEENATMLIALLNVVGASDIPTVQELVDDFNNRM